MARVRYAARWCALAYRKYIIRQARDAAQTQSAYTGTGGEKCEYNVREL